MEIMTISSKEVTQLLSMAECIEVMETALCNMVSGVCHAPQRQALWLPDKSGLLGTMPAFDTEFGKLGIKIMTVFPGNHKLGKESHQGIIVLFDHKNGQPLAILNAGEITAIRTAAVSAVATRQLALESAADLLILGCGVQAVKHVEAMMSVRPISRIRAWDLYPSAAEKFANKVSLLFNIDVEIQNGDIPVVEEAEIICTLTPSANPVLFGRDLTPGIHINAVGSCTPGTREVDSVAIEKSKVFVDKKEAVLNEAGDLLIPISEGIVKKEHIIGEIGQVCGKKIPGRQSPKDITFFESVGLAVEDLAAASFIYEKAKNKGLSGTINL